MMYRLLQIPELAPALIDLLIQIKSQVKSLILLKNVSMPETVSTSK